MSVEGSLQILRNDGSPTRYDVTFASNSNPGGALPVRQFIGDEALEDFLRRGVGVHEDVILATMKGVRSGRASVPHVILTPEQQRLLKL